MTLALRDLRKNLNNYLYFNFDSMTEEQRLDIRNMIDQIDYLLKGDF
jgi:hypothetical protein